MKMICETEKCWLCKSCYSQLIIDFLGYYRTSQSLSPPFPNQCHRGISGGEQCKHSQWTYQQSVADIIILILGKATGSSAPINRITKIVTSSPGHSDLLPWQSHYFFSLKVRFKFSIFLLPSTVEREDLGILLWITWPILTSFTDQTETETLMSLT